MVGYFFDCLSMLEPEALLEKTFKLVCSNMLKPRTNLEKLNEIKNSPLYFLIDLSE